MVDRKERDRRYVQRLRNGILRRRRRRCLTCWIRERLQLAHRRETGVRGQGRGRRQRFQDAKRNARAYALLCIACHRLYDGGLLHAPSRGRGWRCDLVTRDEAERILRSATDFIYGHTTGLRPTESTSDLAISGAG